MKRLMATLLGAAGLWLAAAPSSAVSAASPPGAAIAVDVERGLAKCRFCHGDDLRGKPTAPPIAGLKARRILAKLTADVPRRMQPIARGLSDAERRAIAAHISELPPAE